LLPAVCAACSRAAIPKDSQVPPGGSPATKKKGSRIKNAKRRESKRGKSPKKQIAKQGGKVT
jgi:hypothetical protein